MTDDEPIPVRKWQMNRIASGDYTLLSNDETTLWRIRRYRETGDLYRGQDDGTWRVIKGTFWSLLRFARPPGTLTADDIDDPYLAWDDETWTAVATTLPTRQAAIDEAMEREP